MIHLFCIGYTTILKQQKYCILLLNRG